MNKKAFLITVSLFLIGQSYCVLSERYFWPLTPLNMFAQYHANREEFSIYFLDESNRPVMPSMETLFPFGPARFYFFNMLSFARPDFNPERFLELNKLRVLQYRERFPAMKRIKKIVLWNPDARRKYETALGSD